MDKCKQQAMPSIYVVLVRQKAELLKKLLSRVCRMLRGYTLHSVEGNSWLSEADILIHSYHVDF